MKIKSFGFCCVEFKINNLRKEEENTGEIQRSRFSQKNQQSTAKFLFINIILNNFNINSKQQVIVKRILILLHKAESIFMKKGILNEIKYNKLCAASNSGNSGQLLSRKQNINNNQLQYSNQNKLGSVRQNLIVSCDDDDGVDITKFDSNTCIDQENDSKYENYRNEQYQQETNIHGHQVKQYNINQMNFNKNKGQNTINQYNKSKNNNVSKEFYESSRNHNTTFSAIGSICDEDDELGSRSVNKQTINEIMKAMPKSAQQILERIMGRKTNDESKVTLNPSQSQDYQDDQIQLMNSQQLTQSNSQKKCKQGGEYIQSFQGHNKDSQNKNNSRTNLFPHSSSSNNNNQKENKQQPSYLKLLHSQGIVKTQQNNRNQIQHNKQQQGVFNQLYNFQNQVINDRCQNQQIPQNKNNYTQDANQINQKIINSHNKNNFQSLNKQPEKIQKPLQKFQESRKNQNLDDFSFELEKVQKRLQSNNSVSPQRSKSNSQFQKKEKVSNAAMKNSNHGRILDQLENSLIGFNSNSTNQINQSRDEQYISNQATKYQFDINQNDNMIYQDQKQGSTKSIKSMNTQKSKNKQVNLNQSLGKNELMTNINNQYNFQGRINNHSSSSSNQFNIPVEITFSLDRNNPHINKHLFNQQHQNLFDQLMNKNQQHMLNGVKDKMSQSQFFQRLFSPSQVRSESVGNRKNQNKNLHQLDRCASSLSQYRNNNIRDDKFCNSNSSSNKLNNQNINNKTKSSQKIKNYQNIVRSQTQDVFLVDNPSQISDKYMATQNLQKSFAQLNSQNQQANDKMQRSEKIKKINTKQVQQSRGRLNNNMLCERSKSSLLIDRQDNTSSTFRTSPTLSQSSFTVNLNKKGKKGLMGSTNNLDNFKSLNIGRSNTPNQDNMTMERSKIQTNKQNIINNQGKNKSQSIDNFITNQKLNNNANRQSLSQERLKSLSRSGSYLSEGRQEINSQAIKSKVNQEVNYKFKGKPQQKNQSLNNNLLKQENINYQNEFIQSQQINQNVVDNKNQLIQKNQQNSMNTSLSSQINKIIMLHQQQQNINQSQESFSSKILQNDDFNRNNLNQLWNLKNENQIFSNKMQEENNRKQPYHEGNFFKDNSFGGKEKYSSSLNSCNIQNIQEKQPLDKFQSHISSISQDSYRNYENLEARCVDTNTVNEIMKQMPQSAQQLLQKIMSRGQDTSQVIIQPTKQQNNQLLLNSSFDIDSEPNGYQKIGNNTKNITNSIIPSLDPTSIRDDEDLGEDQVWKQSNSTDIEQIVKQLNFEQNSSSFASSSNEKRCRSNSLSKSFSSNSKERFGINSINSNQKYHPRPYDDNSNMIDDEFRFDSRLKSLEKMINLSENGSQKQQLNQTINHKHNNEKNFNIIQQSFTKKQQNPQKSLNQNHSHNNISFDEINNQKQSNNISLHSERIQNNNNYTCNNIKQIYNSGKKNQGLKEFKQFDELQNQQKLEQELHSLAKLTPEQIKLLEELTRQQMIEISKRDLNLSQTSFKSNSSIKVNKQNSSQIKSKSSKDMSQNSINKETSSNENLISFSQNSNIKPSLIINPPVPKEFQNISKISNMTANNSSICNTSQTNESFVSLIQKANPSLVSNNSIGINSSLAKNSSNYRGKQKKNFKGSDNLNQSNHSTEIGSQTMNQSSLITRNNNLLSGSKSTIEDSLAIEKSSNFQQSTNLGIFQHPLMAFKQLANVQINKNNINGNSNRVKKLNDTLHNLSSQLTINQINENKQSPENRAFSVDEKKYNKSPNKQNKKFQRNNNNFDSPQTFYKQNSDSCISSEVPKISKNSVLNRSLKDIQCNALSVHKIEFQTQGKDISLRSINSAQRGDQQYFTNSQQLNNYKEELLQNQIKIDSQTSSKADSSKRNYSLNNQDMISSQFLWGQSEETGTKRYLENLQLTVSEKEAEIISLKLQVQDLQEVLDKQKFLQSSQKKVSKKKYNEIEEKIIFSRINIGSQLQNSGSAKSINSVISNPSDIKKDFSEQKFSETYPKNLLYINSTNKKQNLVKECLTSTQSQNQDFSIKQDKINITTDLSANLCDSDRSNLKLNASEIDLTYQINQFTLNKQKEEEYERNEQH